MDNAFNFFHVFYFLIAQQYYINIHVLYVQYYNYENCMRK